MFWLKITPGDVVMFARLASHQHLRPAQVLPMLRPALSLWTCSFPRRRFWDLTAVLQFTCGTGRSLANPVSIGFIVTSGGKFTGMIIFFEWVSNRANRFLLRKLLLIINFLNVLFGYQSQEQFSSKFQLLPLEST